MSKYAQTPKMISNEHYVVRIFSFFDPYQVFIIYPSQAFLRNNDDKNILLFNASLVGQDSSIGRLRWAKFVVFSLYLTTRMIGEGLTRNKRSAYGIWTLNWTNNTKIISYGGASSLHQIRDHIYTFLRDATPTQSYFDQRHEGPCVQYFSAGNSGERATQEALSLHIPSILWRASVCAQSIQIVDTCLLHRVCSFRSWYNQISQRSSQVERRGFWYLRCTCLCGHEGGLVVCWPNVLVAS